MSTKNKSSKRLSYVVASIATQGDNSLPIGGLSGVQSRLNFSNQGLGAMAARIVKHHEELGAH